MHDFAQLKEQIEDRVQQLSFDKRPPFRLYEPIYYILSLSGKRIRPILTMLTYEMASGKSPTEAINLGLALELFHNFSLMHDDIMDRAPVRRGMPSVHVKWDESTAILSGDALFAFSMNLLIQDFAGKASVLIKEYTQVSLEVCEGQMEDMVLAEEPEANIPEYLEMIRKKTAALLGGCMTLGAMAAGKSTDEAAHFRAVGENMGLAFQLQDDLMDAFPPEGFGKQIGGDIIENKKTYLFLKALEEANGAQRGQLNQLFSLENKLDSTSKVAQTLGLYEQLHIREHTQELIEAYFSKAKQAMETLSASYDLSGLIGYLEVIAKRKI